MTLACASCPVRDRAACSVLSDEERGDLARAGRTRRLTRGETLFASGDANHACATLLRGALKVCSVNEDGTERILALVHPAGFTGELFSPFTSYDVVALTDCELCVFARSEMTQAIDAYPHLARALLRRSEEELHRSRDLLALDPRQSARARVAGLIRALAEAASDSPCHPAQEFDLPLTRGEMASMLGLTIETISRNLTRLESAGAIRRKGARGIELVDPARLECVD